MARRLFNGNAFSEDGWPYVDEGSCRWVKISADAQIEIQDGIPATVMGAFARDYDAYIEPIFDPDSACWTPGNSVATSNHPGGTAMDLRWESHRFEVKNTFNGAQQATIHELLNWYEGMIFWGGDWESPIDEMHWQMGYHTYDTNNDRPEPKCQDFVNRKIRADGFSTFRRGAMPPPPPPSTSYGMPTGSSINYGAPGFPDWVYQLGRVFGIQASTYPGHQETDRNEAGFAPNPQHLNRAIDWNGSVDSMQRFADYCLSIRTELEQVIWQNPNTGQRVGVAGGRDVTNTPYYADDYGGHTDHVHTRQSHPIPMPGGPPPPPPPPPPPNAADVLARATGIALVKAQQILPTVQQGLRLSECINVNRIAMWLAQMGHESASFVYTEEIQSGDESTDRWLYKGRTWIQITWRTNYAQFSQWLFDKGLISSPTYFVDHPKELAQQQWAGIGPAWYWTVARPQINSLCDKRDLFDVTQAINGGQNGAPDRKRRYDMALALGDQLLALIGGTPPPPPPPGEDDWLNMPSNQEKLDAIYNALFAPRPPENIYREASETVGQNLVDSIRSTLSMTYEGVVERLALLGESASIDKVVRVARGLGPEQRPWAVQRAQLIWQKGLAGPAAVNAERPVAQLPAVPQQQPSPPPQVVYLPAVPEPTPTAANGTAPDEPKSTGQVIGDLYEALDNLRLADALPIEARAPLAALISVLTTKNGSQL